MKSLFATACAVVLLLAAADQAAAGQADGVKAATTGTAKANPPTVVRDHRGDTQRLREAPRKCYRNNHTHLPDGSCVSTWAQSPGVKIRDHRAGK
jgi:hypothetical protein